jgi:uncharacterized protein YbcI
VIRPPLSAICNEAAKLHREHFGRGPGAVKSYMVDDLVVCVLTDVFTPMEKTLIEKGRADLVRAIRAAHSAVVRETYMQRMAETIGRPVTNYESTISIGPDIVANIFILDKRHAGC